jgi:hypothetical protein
MYDHVDDEMTREVLQSIRTDIASITEALSFADQCLQADQHNEDVPHDVYDMRAEHLMDAYDTWLESGDVEQTIIALRLFWEV